MPTRRTIQILLMFTLWAFLCVGMTLTSSLVAKELMTAEGLTTSLGDSRFKPRSMSRHRDLTGPSPRAELGSDTVTEFSLAESAVSPHSHIHSGDRGITPSPFSSLTHTHVAASRTPQPERTVLPTSSLNQDSHSTLHIHNHLYHDGEILRCQLPNIHLDNDTVRKTVALELPTGNGNTSQGSMPIFCSFSVSAVQGRQLHMLILKQTCTRNETHALAVRESFMLQSWSGCERRFVPGLEFVATRRLVEITVRLHHPTPPYELQVLITARVPTVPDELEIYHVSPLMGYVQSPGWDPFAGHTFPDVMNSTAVVKVPGKVTVMLSVVHLETNINYFQTESRCYASQLRVFTTGGNVWEPLCGYWRPPVVLLRQVRRLYAEFWSWFNEDGTGFRLLFTFHSGLRSPQRAGRDRQLWNCSVPYWEDFKPHVLCNMHQECFAGEDEATCPGYTSCTQHGHSGFVLGGSCFFRIVHADNVSWVGALKQCAESGGRLASLNQAQDWEKVLLGPLNLDLYHSHQILIGLRWITHGLPYMYRQVFSWADSTLAYYVSHWDDTEYVGGMVHCGEVSATWMTSVTFQTCSFTSYKRISVCEVEDFRSRPPIAAAVSSPADISLHRPSNLTFPFPHVTCPLGHVTRTFLACDAHSACWASSQVSREGSGTGVMSCEVSLRPLPPSWNCDHGKRSVSYSLVCDHRHDCLDRSDEEFCVFPQCSPDTHFPCGSNQCLPREKRCNQIEDCFGADDEEDCGEKSKSIVTYGLPSYVTGTSNRIEKATEIRRAPPPAVVLFDGRGNFTSRPLHRATGRSVSHVSVAVDEYAPSSFGEDSEAVCPETHFQCPGDDYCLPVYVRCNGVYDCMSKEDERSCENYMCPGFYRCRASGICVHRQDLCDGWPQCPQHDDELLCDQSCPSNCTCYGRAFLCPAFFQPAQHAELRYVDAKGSGMSPESFKNNSMLVFLRLANCALSELGNLNMPNLNTLDLSNNNLSFVTIKSFVQCKNLKSLSLAGNHLHPIFEADRNTAFSVDTLWHLDLSRVQMPSLNFSVFARFPNLRRLNLSGSGLLQVHENLALEQLHELDLRGCAVSSFPRRWLKDLPQLHCGGLWADNPMLCCAAVLPQDFPTHGCYAPSDPVSSCESLLRSRLFKVTVTLCAVTLLTASLLNVLFCVVRDTALRTSVFGIFWTNLMASNFFLGVQQAMLSAADAWYQGQYWWQDATWRNSSLCAMAGLLSLTTHEVSAMILCLMTVDRILLLFVRSFLHFTPGSAGLLSGVVWMVGLGVGTVPLLSGSSHWQLYSHSALCTPLPVTDVNAPAHGFIFSIYSTLNLTLTSVQIAGQVVVLAITRINYIPTVLGTWDHIPCVNLARRLRYSAVLELVCWSLVTLTRLSAVPLPQSFAVGLAIFLLPVKAALHPIMFAISVLQEKARRSRQRLLLKRIEAKLRQPKGNNRC